MRKLGRVLLGFLGGLAALALVLISSYISDNLTYFDHDMAAVWRAGFVERQVTVNGNVIHYAEGPDNGPALLLIHGQMMDWKNYARVLPELSQHYHIYAIDCYGHGRSEQAHEKYSANALGADLATFLRDVIGESAVVSGHSSGGLLAAWLAANAPDVVSGVVLEDPPLFTTVLPRAAKTWNYVDLATSAHDFLESGDTDFVRYNAEHSRFLTLFGGLQETMSRDMLAYRDQHPDAAVRLYYMPPVLNEVFRGMDRYDPRFGDAFYTGAWDAEFDHGKTLAAIAAPAVLIHTNWSYDADGILMAAMDDRDAERARALLGDVRFYQVDSGHGFHFEKPQDFIEILVDFETRIRR